MQRFNSPNNRFAALALGGAIILAGSAVAYTQKSKAESSNPPAQVAMDERPVARATGGLTSFAPIVKKVSPGVVKVFTTVHIQNTAYSGGGTPGTDDFLRRF